MVSTDTTNMAMVATSGPSLEYQAVNTPKPGPGQILIQTSHAAQNPTDVQSFDAAAFGDGAVYGCDFVGTVVELGENSRRFAIGDVVAALIWGGEIKGLGAFANYTLADEAVAFKVPAGVSRASASTIPLAITTSWLALFSKSCLSMDRGQKQHLLIWGGSSSVGQYAIQLASLYSFSVIATCSPRNFDLVKRLGATHVFDHGSADTTKRICEVAPGLKYVFDTIGNNESSAQASQAADANCTLCTVRPGKANTDQVAKSVKITDVLVWTAFLRDHSYGKFHWPADIEDHELAAELHIELPRWLEEGQIKANEVLLLKGLQSVPEGFDMYRQGKISGRKLVYEI